MADYEEPFRGGAGLPLPKQLPDPEPVPEPVDRAYPGVLRVDVDATDMDRRIFRVHETIPVQRAGPLVLLYAKWLPGYHSPAAPIELFAGLSLSAGGAEIAWRRHPVTVNAFYVDVPEGVNELAVEFQFLSPTDASQGRVIASRDMAMLQWNAVILYPAGHFARRIEVEASILLPPDWQLACALTRERQDGGRTWFARAALDVVVDSPLLAGRHFRSIELDQAGAVRLALVADEPRLLAASEAQIAPHRALVEEADLLFGARHFDHFDMLLAMSGELEGIGVEHHRSCEAVTIPDYFTGWDDNFLRRNTLPHEYVHSWNGKHRRGADSWAPCFEKPIRNSLMWVYEGQTQYWGQVLCARSGLWTADQVLQRLAHIAALYDLRPGSLWRPLSDTTRDPIIAARDPLPWTSWQRSEDYYSEGALIWLDVDTRIRELTGDTRSLDDFARAFFGRNDGSWSTDTYVFEDVMATLNGVARFDWSGFFTEELHIKRRGAPLDGITRGGYRLVFRDSPTEYILASEKSAGNSDLSFSLGATVATSGVVGEVIWDSPAFKAGLTAKTKILAVNGRDFTVHRLKQSVRDAAGGTPLRLQASHGKHVREVEVECTGGLRYPHLERVAQAARLDAILAPLRKDQAAG